MRHTSGLLACSGIARSIRHASMIGMRCAAMANEPRGLDNVLVKKYFFPKEKEKVRFKVSISDTRYLGGKKCKTLIVLIDILFFIFSCHVLIKCLP